MHVICVMADQRLWRDTRMFCPRRTEVWTGSLSSVNRNGHTNLVLNQCSCKLNLKVHISLHWHWEVHLERFFFYPTHSVVIFRIRFWCRGTSDHGALSWHHGCSVFCWGQIVILISNGTKTPCLSIPGASGVIGKAGKIHAYQLQLLLHWCMCRFSVTTIILCGFMNLLTGYDEQHTSVGHLALELEWDR